MQFQPFTLAAAIAAVATALPASAQDTTTFFGAQRFWYATQSTNIVDAAIVVNPATGGTVLQTRLTPVTSSAVVSVTSLGLRHGRWLLTGSVSPSAGFDGGGQTNGQMTRREIDLTAGYVALPGATVSLIYKRGSFRPDQTAAADVLLGPSGSASGKALLLGASLNAALQDGLSVYANVAYGPGRWTSNNATGATTASTRYTVSDFGLSWRVGGAANLALQLGFRSQVIAFRGVGLPSYSTTLPPQQLAVRTADTQSTTQGVVVGLGASF